MQLIKCSNGHFYDSSKFSECPYCAQAGSDMTILQVGLDVPKPQDAERPPEQKSEPVQAPPVAQPSHEFQPPHTAAGRAPVWGLAEDQNRTVGYYAKMLGVEPVVGYLIAISGPYFGESFKLKTGRNFIGRSPEMDVQLSQDPSVSRRKHAIVIYEPKARAFIAQPGESRELFYLNDAVVLNNVALEAYDVLSIGETQLMFLPLCGERFSWDNLRKDGK